MRRALMGNPATVVRRVRRKDGSRAIVRTELIPAFRGLVMIHATDLTMLYETLERVSESEGVLARAQEIGRTAAWVRIVGEDTVRWFAERGVLVTPGDFYGEAGARHVRVAMTATDAQIDSLPGRLTLA